MYRFSTQVFILIFLLTFLIDAQSANEPKTIPGIRSFEIKSINVNDTFVIDVSLPASYDDNPDAKYRVLYLTDGYWRRGQHQPIHDSAKTENVQEMIIVGIGYPDSYYPDEIRKRDLLKGADKFLNFILNELMPRIEKDYRTIPTERTLWGASFGGYFVMYTFFQCADLTKGVFKNYIVASPDAYQRTEYQTTALNLFGYEYLLHEKTKVINENLYLAVGGDEEHRFMNSFDEFVKLFAERKYEGLYFKSFKDPGKNHFTVWEPALFEGIRIFMKKK
jgi:predicted alpha/beta superfamily hydrolase